MKLLAISALLLGVARLGDAFMVNSPASVVQCQPVMLSWNGGTPPYYLALIPPGQPGGQAIKQWPSTSGTDQTWLVDLASGTGFSIEVTDNTGQAAYSSAENVQSGPDSSCLNSSLSETSGGAGPTMAASSNQNTTASANAAVATTSGSSSGSSSSMSTNSGSLASKASSASSSAASATKSSNAASRGPSVGVYGAAAAVGLVAAVLF